MVQRVLIPVLLMAPGALAGQQIRVGLSVQVSAALPREPHHETIMAADPANPGRLMACAMLIPRDNSDSETVTYVSFDGGRTWQLSLRVRGDGDRHSWDPDCGYAPDGSAYSISEGMDSTYASYIRIDQSTDGGRSWTSSRRLEHFERAFHAFDRTAGPRRGWLYIHGQDGARTTGGKRGYISGLSVHVIPPAGASRTLRVLSGDDSFVINAGPGVVLSDGTFVGMFTEIKHYWDADGGSSIPPNRLGRQADIEANAWLKVARLEPGSERPAVDSIGDFFSVWGHPTILSSSTIASLAADGTSGPFKDRLYAAWPDMRSGRVEILFAYSADAGKSWSTPRAVNDDRPTAPFPQAKGPDHLMPVVAVNRAGVVGVMWYDRRARPDGLGWDVRFAASLDGGDTFTPSVVVSDRPHDPAGAKRWDLNTYQLPLAAGGAARAPLLTTIGVHYFDFTGGHTAGLAADPSGTFFPLWVSNATGTAQLWTAPVRVEGAAIEHGDSALVGLKDVSASVKPNLANTVYDVERKVIELELSLKNEGRDTVEGPISLRLLALRSELGMATVLDADNGRSGAGAIWRFAAELEGGVLLPGQRTRSRRVRFRVDDLDPLHITSGPFAGLAIISTRVFARASQP